MGSTLDLIQTFAALSETQPPADRKMDGYDLSPVLKGTSTESTRSEFFYWKDDELFAVRSGKWKLHLQKTEPVYYWNKTGMLEKPELYNLEADISEKYDRSETEPEIVAKLTQMFANHKEDITDPLPDNLAARIEEE